jgi:hypothetical protein
MNAVDGDSKRTREKEEKDRERENGRVEGRRYRGQTKVEKK